MMGAGVAEPHNMFATPRAIFRAPYPAHILPRALLGTMAGPVWLTVRGLWRVNCCVTDKLLRDG